MPNYSVHIQKLSRKSGRNAVKAAAYRDAARYTCPRTGETFDYRRKTGVVATEVFGWAGSAVELWGAAELAENRSNSLVAREATIALPIELAHQWHLEIARRIAGAAHIRLGVAGSFAIHEPTYKERLTDPDPDSEAEEELGTRERLLATTALTPHRNPHLHLMFTTRKVEGGRTFGGKTTTLDNKRTGGPEFAWFRKTCADIINAVLQEAGADARVDHRSLAARAAAGEISAEEAIPKRHLGPKDSGIERRGRRSKNGDWNRAIEDLRKAVRELGMANAELAEAMSAMAAVTAVPAVQMIPSKTASAMAMGVPFPSSIPDGSPRRRQPETTRPTHVFASQPDAMAVGRPGHLPVGFEVTIDGTRRYLLDLLPRHYERHLARSVGQHLARVEAGSHAMPIRVCLKDGTWSEDDGRRVSSPAVTHATANVMAAMAKTRGLDPVTITGGTEEERARLWIAAQFHGLDVHPSYVPPVGAVTAWHELRRRLGAPAATSSQNMPARLGQGDGSRQRSDDSVSLSIVTRSAVQAAPRRPAAKPEQDGDLPRPGTRP